MEEGECENCWQYDDLEDGLCVWCQDEEYEMDFEVEDYSGLNVQFADMARQIGSSETMTNLAVNGLLAVRSDNTEEGIKMKRLVEYLKTKLKEDYINQIMVTHEKDFEIKMLKEKIKKLEERL